MQAQNERERGPRRRGEGREGGRQLKILGRDDGGLPAQERANSRGRERGRRRKERKEGGREGGGAEARGEPAGERGVVAIIKVGAIVYH